MDKKELLNRDRKGAFKSKCSKELKHLNLKGTLNSDA